MHYFSLVHLSLSPINYMSHPYLFLKISQLFINFFLYHPRCFQLISTYSLSLGTKLLMEKTPNSTEEEEEALTRKLQEILDEFDKEETGKFCFQEEKVEEMMQELYKEITSCASHELSNSPISIHDVNNESCGVLISGSKSSIMAGIKVVSSTSRFPVTRKRLATVTTTENENISETLFRFKEEKERRKFFNDEDHLDCEWVGRILQNWWF